MFLTQKSFVQLREQLFYCKTEKLKCSQTKDIAQRSPLNLEGAPAGSHHAVFHSLKNLLDLHSRDTSFPHNGDSSCENSEMGMGWDKRATKMQFGNIFLLPSLIFRQLTTVDATTSFECPSLRTPWILCPSRLWPKRGTVRERVSGHKQTFTQYRS